MSFANPRSTSALPRRWLVVVAAASVVLAGCTSGGSIAEQSSSAPASGSPSASDPGEAALQGFYAQSLSWGDCPKSEDGQGGQGEIGGGEAQCADLSVPLDYAKPEGETIKLKVLRVKARKSAARVGSLVLNPGGPGGSGVEYASFVPVRDKVADVYDIVGFDPRGVGNSTPVSCMTPEQIDELVAADGTPDNQKEIDEIGRLSAEVGAGCKERSPSLAGYLDTESAARDMDILRSALGEKKLTYLGKSYGTYLGAVYASLFPTNVGRVVLDGVLPPGLDGEEISKGQALGFEDALKRFIKDCARQDDCPLPKDPDAAYKRIQAFLADLEKQPIDGLGKRKLNEALATYAIVALLYFPPSSWSQLRFGLEAAFDGDGSVLLSEVDRFLNRNPDGSYNDNAQDAFYAISCLDRPASGGVERAATLAKAWAKEAPIFGPYLAWGLPTCNDWPFPGKTPQPATAPGAPPMLVVSTKHDPATPYEWGVEVAKELGNARLVSFDGDGHTAYMSEVGSLCVDKLVDDFLIKGNLPAEDRMCEADS